MSINRGLSPHQGSHFLAIHRGLLPRTLAKPDRPFPRSCVAASSRQGGSKASKRGVLILPGLGNNQRDYLPLAELLKERGLVVEVASVSRADWLRNAAGLTDVNYWKGTLNPRPVVDWYLNKVDTGLKLTAEKTEGGSISILAHSAGGWLARVYLLGFGHQGIIDRLVTLGSPHLPPPQGSKVVDQTRGILTFVENNCPGRFHEEVQYVSIAGKYIRGAKLRDKNASLRQKVIGLGYQQVCGETEVWGDGVVPEPSAHLPGSLQISLDNVYHSPVGSRDGTNGKEGRLWYGSKTVLEQWVHHLEDDIDSGSSGVMALEDITESSVPA